MSSEVAEDWTTTMWQMTAWRCCQSGYLDKKSFGGVLGRIGGMDTEELRTERVRLLRRYAD